MCMSAEEYLSQAYKLNEQIKDKQERIASLNELRDCIGSIDYSKDKVQTSQQADALFARQILKLLELEEELKQSLIRLCELKVEIGHAVDAVENVNHRLVLSKKYILMKTMEQIAEDMGYSVQHIYRIHEKALENFIIPKT